MFFGAREWVRRGPGLLGWGFGHSAGGFWSEVFGPGGFGVRQVVSAAFGWVFLGQPVFGR